MQVHEELCLVHEAYQFFRGRFITKVNQLSLNKNLEDEKIEMFRDKTKWVHVEGLLDMESKIGLANKVENSTCPNVQFCREQKPFKIISR